MIRCEGLWKSYPMGHGRKDVLKGIDLAIAPGQKFGFLGRNGAGKTTLIKLIGGVEMPTAGRVRREMTVSWPLGFGGGFQGSLTGYDNARFIARIYGRRYSELRGFIEDFTELGRQLKMPVKTYSSGMKARLAFGLSLAIEFDCYLIDEIILVGDANFQKKCQYELFEKRADRAMVLASHDTYTIREFCDHVAVIDQGQVSVYDDVDAAIALYETL